MIISSHRSGDCQLLCDVPKCFALLSALPGRKKWVDRTLVFQPTGANIEYIVKHWPEAQWSDGTAVYLNVWIALKQQEQNTREEKHNELVDESGYIYKTVPFVHQKQAFILGRDFKAFAYLHEQGCGKTKVIIDIFAYLWERDRVDVLVVVAPNGVHSNWIINEIPAHLPPRIKAKLFTYSASMKKSLHDEMHKAATKSEKRACAVTAFNVEGFVSDKAKGLLEAFLKNHRCLLVIDESNSIQNPSAARTKYLIKAGKSAHYRSILCGTPITRGVENLYSQFKFLDPMILGYESYHTFKAQFCIMGGFEQRQIVGYRHIQELSNTIDGHSHRVLKADCLDLPNKIYKKHFFDMTPNQKIYYDTVRKSAVQDLTEVFGKEHGESLAKEIAITRMIRLQQIACGWVPYKSGETPIPIEGGNPRQEALITLLKGVEGKAIIWITAVSCMADIHAIAHLLHKAKMGEVVQYHGQISDSDRTEAIRRFQTDSKVKWFLASKAAAIGLTLTAAEEAYYYSNNFDLRIRLQSEDRNHRIGSEVHDHILYTDIYTNGIDKKIVTALRNKKSIADQITHDPVSLFME